MGNVLEKLNPGRGRPKQSAPHRAIGLQANRDAAFRAVACVFGSVESPPPNGARAQAASRVFQLPFADSAMI